MIVEIYLEETRGTSVILYVGNFEAAKAWAQEKYPQRRLHYREAPWASPNSANVLYSQAKAMGDPEFTLVPWEVRGPVAFQFFRGKRWMQGIWPS